MVTEHAIGRFWVWFQDSEESLLSLKPDEIVETVSQRITRVHPGLGIEVNLSQSTPELVLTAYGNEELFPLVRRVVADAPGDVKWRIVALKEGHGFDFTMRGGGATIDASRLPFEPLESQSDSRRVGIRVLVPIHQSPDTDWIALVRLCLMSGIGEYLLSKIGYLDVADSGTAPSDPLYLPELASFIDWRSRRGRGEGELRGHDT